MDGRVMRVVYCPILPPLRLRMTTVAGRGRLPKGQLLTLEGLSVVGAPNWLFQKLVDSPGCCTLTNMVR